MVPFGTSIAVAPVGDVAALRINGEVDIGNGQFRFQQALIDGAELAYTERAEIHRPERSFRRLDQQQVIHHRLERRVTRVDPASAAPAGDTAVRR